MAERAGPRTEGPEEWLATLDELLDEGVEREEHLHVSAEDLSVEVPVAFGEETPRAEWRFDGDLTVQIDGVRGSLAEWFRLYGETPPRDATTDE
ncbi:hypothetical protein [Halosegnis sp.]|uniref:hypothetical protein n=1 Tax=Halosegnis sp. TaxID=2864959 RepID=UPI0035D4DFED